MIEWLDGLPQNPGFYLWHVVDDPHSSAEGVVYVGNTAGYTPQEYIEGLNLGNPKAFFYKNKNDEWMIICWGRIIPAINKNGMPEVDGWAAFNFPK